MSLNHLNSPSRISYEDEVSRISRKFHLSPERVKFDAYQIIRQGGVLFNPELRNHQEIRYLAEMEFLRQAHPTKWL